MGDESKLPVILAASAVFLATVIIGRVLNDSALKGLSSEQKDTLVEAVSARRNYSVPISLLVVFGVLFIHPLSAPVAGSACIFVDRLITMHGLQRRRFPASFLRVHLAASVIIFVGFSAAWIMIAVQGWF